MKLIQRIGQDPEVASFLLSALEKYPGCFTDVWMNTAYGCPKNETHKEIADQLAVLASQLREKGVNVSMQLSNSLGHGAYNALMDCTCAGVVATDCTSAPEMPQASQRARRSPTVPLPLGSFVP